jgi:hypothetical protein
MSRKEEQSVETITHVTLKVYEVDRGHRKVFSIAHREDGRRLLKQFADQKAALTWALNRAKEISRGKPPSVTLAPTDAVIYQRAKQVLSGTGKDTDKVAQEYVDAMDTLGGAVRLDDVAA